MQVHIKIYGRVQGVFFRSQAKATAQSLGLTGWIRNIQSHAVLADAVGLNDDGLVEAVAEGSKEKLDKFVEWCKKGPPLARVDTVEVDWSNQEKDFNEFEVS